MVHKHHHHTSASVGWLPWVILAFAPEGILRLLGSVALGPLWRRKLQVFLLSLFFIKNKNVEPWETMPTFRKAGKKSTSYELLNNNVDYGTRKVDRMPAAYCDRASPYRDRVDFSDRTKRVCRSKNAGTVTPFYLCACKVIFVGDVATGKSSLVNRFCHEIFDAEYRGTIGVDFEVEKFQVLGHSYSLQM